jgi:hypothetical protein
LRKRYIEKSKKKLGLKLNLTDLSKAYSRVFPERHDITIVYLRKCTEGKIKLDSEHSEYKLFKKLPKGLHTYLLETIKDSQWKKKPL